MAASDNHHNHHHHHDHDDKSTTRRCDGGKIEILEAAALWHGGEDHVSTIGGELWNACARARVGGAKLTLAPLALTLPRYSDSSQICYVLQGNGVVGVVFPGRDGEVVRAVREGDMVVLPLGTVHWWHNSGDKSATATATTINDLSILILADTSQALKYGEITNFHLVGSKDKRRSGIMHGFSKDFLAQAWDLEESLVSTLLDSRSDAGIVKLDAPLNVRESIEEDSEFGAFIYNCRDAKKDVEVKNGGHVAVVTSSNLPILSQIGFSADLVKLDAGAMCSPGFSADAAYQVTYVVRGTGRVQVVNNEGERVLDAEIEGGYFFIVPRFHVVSKRAGADGLEWFSIITKEKPIFSHLAGKTSVWKALSPEVLCAAFGISKELENQVRSRRMEDAIFFPSIQG